MGWICVGVSLASLRLRRNEFIEPAFLRPIEEENVLGRREQADSLRSPLVVVVWIV
jgi:hypothetical protein